LQEEVNVREETLELIKSTFNTERYTEEEAEAGIAFLVKFSDGAVLYLIRLFNSAKAAEIPFFEVLSHCYDTWFEWWERDSERRGDPDNPTNGAGYKNATVLFEIYAKLGIPIVML